MTANYAKKYSCLHHLDNYILYICKFVRQANHILMNSQNISNDNRDFSFN